MELNKKFFLMFLILLIFIIPQTICAEDKIDLSDSISDNMIVDDSNLKLNAHDLSNQDDADALNSIDGIGDVNNGDSSKKHAASLGDSSLGSYLADNDDLELCSTESSALEDDIYFVSDNDNSLEDKLSEELNDDEYSSNMLVETIISNEDDDLSINNPLKNTLKDDNSYNIFIISDTAGNNLFDSIHGNTCLFGNLFFPINIRLIKSFYPSSA